MLLSYAEGCMGKLRLTLNYGLIGLCIWLAEQNEWMKM